MFNKNVLDVLYSTDDNFCEIMGISIMSLIRTNYDNFESINIYIISNEISQNNKNRILKIAASYTTVHVKWLPILSVYDELPSDVNLDRGSIAQYSRLFVARLLSKEKSRVLYLDADTLVNGALTDLWNFNMKGQTIGALVDAFSTVYRQNIMLNPNDIMFNSGVMLIDLDKWRKNHIESKLITFIHDVKGQIQQGDQGALNNVLCHQTAIISPKYNALTVFFDFSYEELFVYRKPPYFYSRMDVEQAKKHPIIIHYTTSFLSNRPWETGSKHVYSAKWNNYKDKSAWKNVPNTHRKRSILARSYLSLSDVIPRGVYVHMSGILHAYLRPLLFSLEHLYLKRMNKNRYKQ